MANEKAEAQNDPMHPRRTAELFGHAEAERRLLDAYRSGRMPHAWLIGGERGIGKATLAFRLARFVLAHPDPTADSVRNATSLAIEPEHAAARRIAAGSHNDVFELKRLVNPKTGKLFTTIRVEDAREFVGFFNSTAGAGGWRIGLVNPLDDLNREGENTLLKLLEEPPPRTLLLLVSHSPGRALPTIRSRCRRLLLRALDVGDVARAAALALGRDPDEPDVVAAAEASGGSVARALMLLEGAALALRRLTLEALAQLPQRDPRALHALADKLSGTEPATLEAFADAVNLWLSSRLRREPQDLAAMDRAARAYDAVNRACLDTDTYNLDRRPLVFSVFAALADVEGG